MPAPTVRPATPADAEALAAIYNEGIADRVATFETRPRSADEARAWIGGRLPCVVAVRDGAVAGFARVAPYSDREAYAGVGEHGVYVARAARGEGARPAPPRRGLPRRRGRRPAQAHLADLQRQRREHRRARGGGLRRRRRPAPPRPPRRRVEGLRGRRAPARRRRTLSGLSPSELLHPRLLGQQEREGEGQRRAAPPRSARSSSSPPATRGRGRAARRRSSRAPRRRSRCRAAGSAFSVPGRRADLLVVDARPGSR